VTDSLKIHSSCRLTKINRKIYLLTLAMYVFYSIFLGIVPVDDDERMNPSGRKGWLVASWVYDAASAWADARCRTAP
jgi:hypothetical protein